MLKKDFFVILAFTVLMVARVLLIAPSSMAIPWIVVPASMMIPLPEAFASIVIPFLEALALTSALLLKALASTGSPPQGAGIDSCPPP